MYRRVLLSLTIGFIALTRQTDAQTPAQTPADSAALAASDAPDDDVTGSAPGHIAPFSEGHHHGWLFASPHFDVNAGAWHSDGTTDAALRMHLQYAPGFTEKIEVAWDLLLIPARGATPTVSAVVQLSPLPEHSRLYANAGAGLITRHSASGDRVTGWLEGTVAYRGVLHDVAAFAQVGHGTGGGNRFEFLLGVAHPLSPYRATHHEP